MVSGEVCSVKVAEGRAFIRIPDTSPNLLFLREQYAGLWPPAVGAKVRVTIAVSVNGSRTATDVWPANNSVPEAPLPQKPHQQSAPNRPLHNHNPRPIFGPNQSIISNRDATDTFLPNPPATPPIDALSFSPFSSVPDRRVRRAGFVRYVNKIKRVGLISLGVVDDCVLFRFSEVRVQAPNPSSDAPVDLLDSSDSKTECPLHCVFELHQNPAHFHNISLLSVGSAVDFVLSHDRSYPEALDIAPLQDYTPFLMKTPQGIFQPFRDADGKSFFIEALRVPIAHETHRVEFKRLFNYKLTDSLTVRSVNKQSILGYVDKYVNAFLNAEGGQLLSRFP